MGVSSEHPPEEGTSELSAFPLLFLPRHAKLTRTRFLCYRNFSGDVVVHVFLKLAPFPYQTT